MPRDNTGDLTGRAVASTTPMLEEDVPLAGSVDGRRVLKIPVRADELVTASTPGDLYPALGPVSSATGETWSYDRDRAVDWLLRQLRELPFSWVQVPWKAPAASTGTDPLVPSADDAGPRAVKPRNDDRPPAASPGMPRRSMK